MREVDEQVQEPLPLAGLHCWSDKPKEITVKTVVLILCSGLIVFTGCSSVHQVGVSENEGWIQEAQNDLLDKDATVTTWQGRVHNGKILQVNGDSLVMQEVDSSVALAIPLHDVNTIRPSRNVLPPIFGFGAGLVAGAAIGAGVGGSMPRRTAGEFAPIAGGFYGAVVGGFAGSVILGLATSVTDYQFADSATHKTQGPSEAAPLDSTSQAK